MDTVELHKMIADYMEKGFLENIIDMFRHDTALYAALPAMISDERSQVRIGTAALVETLIGEHRDIMAAQVGAITALLSHENPTVRGDAIYLLGLIANDEARRAVMNHKDASPLVAALVEEAIRELEAL